jgi:4-hydroxyphenylacetate 3-monooxygenase
MAAVESTIGGLARPDQRVWSWPDGYVCFNRRFMYAGPDWCTQNYSQPIDQLRGLRRRRVQMPADISVMDDPGLPVSSRPSGRRRRATPSRA